MSSSFRFCFLLSPFLAFFFLFHFLFTDSYCTYNMLKPNHYRANKPQLNTAGVEPCRAHSSHTHTCAHTTSQNRKWKHWAGNTCIVLLGLNKPQNLSKGSAEYIIFLNGPRLTACHTWLCVSALQNSTSVLCFTVLYSSELQRVREKHVM